MKRELQGKPSNGLEQVHEESYEINPEDVSKLAKEIAEVLEELKARDIALLLDLPSQMFSAMVVATLDSPIMLESISEELRDEFEDEVFSLFGVRAKVEGLPDGGWVVIDFGEIIVHLFLPEYREYYSIERLWSLELLRAKKKDSLRTDLEGDLKGDAEGELQED